MGLAGQTTVDNVIQYGLPRYTAVAGICYDVGGKGVYGLAGEDAASTGVEGRSNFGRGVHGYTSSGTAGYFDASDLKVGYALRAVGRVKLDRCAGVATIATGTRSIKVTPGIDLVSTSAVVATLQGNAGSGTTTVSRVLVNSTADSFTIYLTADATTSVKVAWIVIG
jgi:hypothetical protein